MSAVRSVGRFAPSPTGPLHVGSLVTAVGSYLAARSSGGEWLLRLEDLDTPRVVHGAADDILFTLEALGLFWDRDVLWQSRRTHLYQEALERLIRDGWAYPCGCSRAEVARIASAGEGAAAVYPGTCRQGLPAGKLPRAFRVRVPASVISFRDGVQGEYARDISRVCGDFVVRRADGPFAYHLAVVVDDAATGVTAVVRGADLIDATPCHLHLQSILGLAHPGYSHLPLVTGPAGAKLSKRDSAVSLASAGNLRRDGGTLIWSALLFLGQRPPLELKGATALEVLAWGAATFDMGRIPRDGGPFPLEVP